MKTPRSSTSSARAAEWVEIGGTRKHVMTYLGDFLFFARARRLTVCAACPAVNAPRLLLARLFARPANVLVLGRTHQ